MCFALAKLRIMDIWLYFLKKESEKSDKRYLDQIRFFNDSHIQNQYLLKMFYISQIFVFFFLNYNYFYNHRKENIYDEI